MNPDCTEPEHHVSLPPILTAEATTTRKLVRRPTSSMTDTSRLSTVPSITPPYPTPMSFSVEKDNTENILKKLPARPLPMLPKESVPQDIRMSQPRINDQGRSIILEPREPLGPCSDLDWIVPVDNKPRRDKTVGERLDFTLLNAITEKNIYASRAKWTGYTLNVAIGIQVLLGTLTTGLSVGATGRQTSIIITVLGALATIVASYLAQARGSNEPELSNTRLKDLEQFIRECEAFKMDHGLVLGHKHDRELNNFRLRFEEILGNINGEQKLTEAA